MDYISLIVVASLLASLVLLIGLLVYTLVDPSSAQEKQTRSSRMKYSRSASNDYAYHLPARKLVARSLMVHSMKN